MEAGETLPYLLLCEDHRVRTKHGFVNKFWRRLKLLGLDLPFGSLKPRVIIYSNVLSVSPLGKAKGCSAFDRYILVI